MLRLQNSPYFCVFKYARAVKQKVWNKAENREQDYAYLLEHFSLLPCSREDSSENDIKPASQMDNY